MMWEQHGDNGNNMGWRQWRPQPGGVETTWGPCEDYGDDMGMTGTTGTMWG